MRSAGASPDQRIVIERGSRGMHSLVDVVEFGAGDCCQDYTVRRVDDIKPGKVTAVAPLTINEMPLRRHRLGAQGIG